MATTVEQLCNQALLNAGHPERRIGDIFEGTPEAKVALELYGQTRDDLQRAQDWSFNRRTLTLTLLKGPPPPGGYSPLQPWTPVYPFPGFLFEYAYPADCLDLGAVVPMPDIIADLDPIPAKFRVDNDEVPVVSGNPPVATGPQAKVILTNVNQAMGVYRAQVTDPTLWTPDFTQMLVDALAQRFRKVWSAQPAGMSLAQTEGGSVGEAKSIRG